LLDYGLGKAIEEFIDDDEVDLETAKRLNGSYLLCLLDNGLKIIHFNY